MPTPNERGAPPDPKWWLIPQPAGPGAQISLPEPFFERYRRPTRYDPGPALKSAVNVALLLGQPLLLTGEPGSGKTSLAYWLAYQMGLEEPLVHVVKSVTTGRDLLYTFDELARFRDAQGGPKAARPQQDYLELSALGLAILFSAGAGGALSRTSASRATDAGAARRHSDLFPGAFPKARRQVVLIDELDKAPRDTPNDLLSEIERMEFRIPELGVVVRGDPNYRPVVVITSNADKNLPEALLRRCVYHHIPIPDEARRREVVALQEPKLLERQDLFDDAMATLDSLHDKIGRDGRRPGTAEMLAWLDTIEAIYPSGSKSLRENPGALGVTLKTLAKTPEDLALMVRILKLDPAQFGFE
ncbi:MoxR family ATPase [Sphingomonas sp. LB-2]|uniref:AAA family ATPase n=1 Tax=Sphingomonas caeni TaxID=2984949 RepID=UPI002230DDE8|nr:MoxR family ATPase [Sphingomonas caeni]MCW3848091.1 MoxR family ATPase [Sphingomonas caeni]